MAEQHFCKVPVVGSSPTMTSISMNNRRLFFKSLIGLIIAPKKLPISLSTRHIQLDAETIYRLVRSKKVVNGGLV